MGGAVSSGENNDELVDNLVEAEYIKSADIEKVFRAVDRADYYLLEHRDSAYRDLAWKHGNIHLSAPCIYAEVLESLKLEEGMSFLNIGSGTSYLSTLAGLVLGPYGINHGIELHKDVIEYAMERQQYFKKNSISFDEFEYCDPQFVNGNCLQLVPDGHLYDRVYCGAACPPEHENYMKNLVRVGGVLVMPLNDQLLQVTRTSETTWETCCVLPVSFATLVVPTRDATLDAVQLPDRRFLSLQEICRVIIRGVLRKNTLTQHPYMKAQKRPKKLKPLAKKRRRFTMLPMSMFGSISDSDTGPAESRLAVAVYDEEVVSASTGREAASSPTGREGASSLTERESQPREESEEEDSEEESDKDMSDVLQRVLEHRLRQGPWRGHRVVHHHDWPLDAGEDQGIEEDMEGDGERGGKGGIVVQPPSLSTSSEDMDSDVLQSPVICGDTLPIAVPSCEKRQRCSSGTSVVSASYTSGVGTCSSVDEHSDIDKANDMSSSNFVHLGSSAYDPDDSDRVINGQASHDSHSDNSRDISRDKKVTVRRRHHRKTVSLSSCDEEEDEDEDMDVGSSASRSPHTGTQSPRAEDEERNEARINFKKCLYEKIDLLPIPLALKQYLLFYRK